MARSAAALHGEVQAAGAVERPVGRKRVGRKGVGREAVDGEGFGSPLTRFGVIGQGEVVVLGASGHVADGPSRRGMG